MIEQAFDVATEFRFDVGEALLNTRALQGAVSDLSKAADGALSSINYLASGLVAHLGFGSGGLLTILSKAVQISEAFNGSALNLANNISSNFNVLSGHINTFNDRLETSEQIMSDISSTAIKFGIDTSQLSSITQLVASPLAARKMLGTNYAGGIAMAKNMMLASESVGLPQHAGAEMLARGLSPGQSIGGKLFERLLQTPAFRSAHVLNPTQLAGMNQDRKIELLSKALEQLAGDSQWLASRLQHVGAQFQILKSQIEVLLKPIGDAIVKPLVKMLSMVNVYLSRHGKEIGENIAKFIGNIFEDPERLLVGLLQLRRFKDDFRRSVDVGGFLFLFAGIGKLLKPIKPLATWVEKFLGVKEGMGFLGILRSDAGILAKVFRLVGAAFADFIPVVASFLFFFQVISRAIAIAKIHDVIAMIDLIPRAMAAIAKMKTGIENILLPITMAIDGLAQMIAWIFESNILYRALLNTFESFATVLDLLGKGVVYAMGGVAAFLYMMIGFVDDIIHLRNPFTSALGNLKTGFQDFMAGHPFSSENNPTVNQVTNIGKIEARFDMREQLEPDRIAFAVTTHLKKLAIDKRQGSGQAIDAAFVRARTA